jgi:hypothetical protein
MNNIHYTRIGDLGMKFHFINGTVTIPNKSGSYVIASGCGAGKTTVIKQIIRDNFDNGILYSAFTIEECDLMYEFCMELVKDINDPSILKDSDIINLNSSRSSKGTDTNLWTNHPEKLADKKIVICTHHKLMNEDPDILTAANFNVITYEETKRSCTDRSMRSRLRSSSPGSKVEVLKPRRFILIDELPTTGARMIEVSRNQLLLLNNSMSERIENLIPEPERRNLNTMLTVSNGTIYRVVDDYRQFVEKSSRLTGKTLPQMYQISPGEVSKMDDRTIDQVRIDLELSAIYDRMSSIWSELETRHLNGEKDPKMRISVSFMNAVGPGKESSVLLFDGTGDITFFGSKVFEIRTLAEGQRKYNSPISITKFDTTLKRRILAGSYDSTVLDGIKKNVDQLERIIRSNNKTLVVTWKNLKEYQSDDEDELPIIINKVNESKSLTDMYESLLGSKGLIKGVNYDIIHYQSGKDKATNQFIDFDSIVFLGEFHIPNSAVAEFNDTFKCETTPKMYLMYQLVQAVCRTRIRRHQGEKINIYYSSDWDDEIMKFLGAYLTTGDSSLFVNNEKKVNLLDSPLRNIREPYKTEIMILDDKKILPGVIRAIEDGSAMNYRVKLEDIYKVVKRSEYKVRSYKKLLDLLKSFSIHVDITTKSDNKGRD